MDDAKSPVCIDRSVQSVRDYLGRQGLTKSGAKLRGFN